MQNLHEGFVCCVTVAEYIGRRINSFQPCLQIVPATFRSLLPRQTNLALLNLPGSLRVAASHAGGILLPGAVLDGSSRVAATKAHKVVSCLLDTSTIPAEQAQAHELMLWRMQGLHRYANLLCPLPVDEGKVLDPDSQPGTPAKLLLQYSPVLALASTILPTICWPTVLDEDSHKTEQK